MKQVDGFGPNGETIIDYSIYDAIKAALVKLASSSARNFWIRLKPFFEPKLAGKVELITFPKVMT